MLFTSACARANPATRGVRVVVLSGTPTPDLEARAHAAGAVVTPDEGATRRELRDGIAAAAAPAA